MARALSLPAKFLSESEGGGVLQGSASEAVIVAMVAARARALRITQDESVFSKLVVYTSTQAHSSFQKAARILGMTMHTLPVNSKQQLEPHTLLQKIEEDRAAGLHPLFVGATVGTTSTGAVDPIRQLGELCNAQGVWLHIDAAYAGSAAVCPEYRHLIDDVELANSFNFNPHKWLLTNFDCSVFWLDDRRDLLTAMSISRPYYKNAPSESGQVLDYRDWQLPLGRRFRALKLWFVFRCFGTEGLQAHIRRVRSLACLCC